MNLWQLFEKTNCTLCNKGITFRYEKGIDPNLRRKYLNFTKWLREKYVFPVHLTVYILDQEKVKLRNGTFQYGSFRWYPKRPPRIKIPSKIEAALLKECSIEEIYEMILSSFVHEISHYFQWVLALEQANAVSERQANYYRFRIIDQYYDEKAVRRATFVNKNRVEPNYHDDLMGSYESSID